MTEHYQSHPQEPKWESKLDLFAQLKEKREIIHFIFRVLKS